MTYTIAVGIAQKDGRVPVTETHVDDVGIMHHFTYLSELNDDRETIASARAPVLLEQLKASEIESVLSNLRAPVLQYATKAALLLVWRELFREARRERASQLAKWILDHLDAGEWTDAQLRTLFNVTVIQYNAIKARLEIMRTRWNEVQLVAGE